MPIENNVMWLDIIIAFSCCGGGLICGWVLRSLYSPASVRMLRSGSSDAVGGSRTNEEPEPTRERISAVADKLRQYAETMAADVDAHQTRVQAVNETLVDYQQTLSTTDIIEAVHLLIEANSQMHQQLQSAQDRIQKQAAQLETAEKQAQTDPLTTLANRRSFDQQMAQLHQLGTSQQSGLALLDIDHFKSFNDNFGHRAGDEVLRVVASILSARLKPHGLVSRFGGEEFAILITGITQQESIRLVELARQAISQRTICFEGQNLKVNLSLGLSFLKSDETQEEWLQRADDGLYRSKDQGRNCGHWMDDKTPVLIDFNSFDQGDRSIKTEQKTEASLDHRIAAHQAAQDQRRNKQLSTGQNDQTPDSLIADQLTVKEVVGEDSQVLDRSQSLPEVPEPAETLVRTNETMNDNLAVQNQHLDSDRSEPSGSSSHASDQIETSPDPVKQELQRLPGDDESDDGARAGAFAYLADRYDLAKDFEELSKRSQLAGKPMHLLVVRYNGDSSSINLRAFLQIVRATAENPDYVGYENNQSLIVLMPGIGEADSIDRASRLGDAMSSSPAGLSSFEGNILGTGIVKVQPDLDFNALVDEAVQLSRQASQPGSKSILAGQAELAI